MLQSENSPNLLLQYLDLNWMKLNWAKIELKPSELEKFSPAWLFQLWRYSLTLPLVLLASRPVLLCSTPNKHNFPNKLSNQSNRALKFATKTRKQRFYWINSHIQVLPFSREKLYLILEVSWKDKFSVTSCSVNHNATILLYRQPHLYLYKDATSPSLTL